MKELMDLKELYLEEIKKINKKGELTPVDSEAAKKALEAIEKIHEICDYDEEGYSERMHPRYARNHRMLPEVPYHDDYYSERRGRNSLGQYTSRRRDGYSRANTVDNMVEKLEVMLHDAPDAETRAAIEKCIDKLSDY